MMKNFKLDTILDQRKIYSHIIFLIFSVSIGIYLQLTSTNELKLIELVNPIILTFLYLESFIFIASKIFNENVVDITNRNFLKMILWRFLFFYLICFFSALLIIVCYRLGIGIFNGGDLSDVIPNFMQLEFEVWLTSTLKGLTFGAFIFLFVQLQSALKKSRQLKEENLIFQNETLKNQINPHFLFNSLNTLSSLVSTDQSLAEDFIQKFSGIYRYILENLKKDRVLLSKELDFALDYFELHKIRDEDKILMKIDRTNDQSFSIPPVSLQILIENAIKHNRATRENPLYISIEIKDHHIIVRNNLQKMASQFETNKTGLKNLKERIQLISNKKLVILETKDEFIVKMPLL